MEEIFKPIPNFETSYEISSYGRIRSLRTNIIMKQYVNIQGYKTIELYKNKNTSEKWKVHQLMGNIFLDKPESDKPLIVDHINEKKYIILFIIYSGLLIVKIQKNFIKLAKNIYLEYANMI